MLKQYNDLLNLDATIAKSLFDSVDHPWEVLPKIESFILEIIPTLGEEYEKYDENIYIHKTAKINKLATIMGPTIIGKDVEVRPVSIFLPSIVTVTLVLSFLTFDNTTPAPV